MLVVEDEEPIQDLIKEYLSSLKIQIIQAFSGEEGVEKYKEMANQGKKPDIVIMDLKLPGMDGVESTKKIIDIDRNALVYGFTAYFGTEWAKELEKAGAKGVIARPVGFDGFRDIISDILKKL
jgi:CheY-like chemotaxis protein